jgi:hypothetical protein
MQKNTLTLFLVFLTLYKSQREELQIKPQYLYNLLIFMKLVKNGAKL